jgi:hypothetical protein
MATIIVSSLPNLTLTARIRGQNSVTTSEVVSLTEDVSESGQYTGITTAGTGVFAVDIYEGASKLGDDTVNYLTEQETFRVGNTATLYDRTVPSGSYGQVTSVSSGAVADIFETYTISEDYAASGAEGTPAQILYFIQQVFSEFSITSTTITVKKLDGSTTAATFEMNSDTSPTSRSRAT